MLRNYFKVALRNLSRSKGYALLNVAGLAAGLACFILILLFVRHELSYDRFHAGAERIYRVVQRQPGNVFMGSDRFAVMPAPLAGTLIAEYPEVETATTISRQSSLLGYGDEHFWEDGLWADARFFEVFSFQLLRGRADAVLAEPGSILLTESLARKIFGESDPIGKTLRHQNRDDYTVTGILADVPRNSTLKFGFVTTIQSQPNYARNLAEQRWNNNSWHVFFRLREGASAERLQAKMPALVDKYVADEEDGPEERNQYFIQPLTDVHLRSNINFDIGVNGDITTVMIFSAIGIVILLLACINYMNLAVARSINRTREVGMRKVVGARKRQLVVQFLGESVLMTTLALLLALAIAHLLLPAFGDLVQRPLEIEYSGLLLPMLIGLVLLVGLVAGSYPAVFMASLRPIGVLKSGTGGGRARFRVQRALIVGQFAISIALVAGSFVIFRQLQFVQEKDLGYDREHVVTVRVRDQALHDNYAAIRNEWLRQSNVAAVTSSTDLPTEIGSSTTIQSWEGSPEEESIRIYQIGVDYDFAEVFGIDLVAGRMFSREVAGDTLNTFLINETAARAMGWTAEEAVGRHFERSEHENTVIGVVKDFHMHSMHLPIEPLMIQLERDWTGFISARVRPGNLTATLAALEAPIRRFSPFPFEYQFLDDTFDQLYASETRLGQTIGFFTILALLIASLGLFGLAAFSAKQRTKEVGIRKVLGADTVGLVGLLSKEFVALVGVAFLIAAPAAYLAAERWLDDFAYRIEIGPGIFLLTGGMALLAALATVSYQAVRAATADPVKSLRYE